MTPLVWTGIAIAAALGLLALWAWLWRAPRIRPFDTDDLDAIAEAVTRPRTVFVVERLHTGTLRVTGSALTVGEANDIGCQLIQAANDALWEHVGIHQAEEYANGEQA